MITGAHACTENKKFPARKMSMFRNSFTFKDRVKMSSRLKEKFTDRIACIVEKSVKWGSRKVPHMERKKFLVPSNMKMCHLVTIIRKRIDIPNECAVIVSVGEEHAVFPCMQTSMRDIYRSYGSDDGFLYVEYGLESTFGTIQ